VARQGLPWRAGGHAGAAESSGARGLAEAAVRQHKEGNASYKVVNKGPETAEDFARRVLAELHDRMPVMVLNDERRHCWRPAS